MSFGSGATRGVITVVTGGPGGSSVGGSVFAGRYPVNGNGGMP